MDSGPEAITQAAELHQDFGIIEPLMVAWGPTGEGTIGVATLLARLRTVTLALSDVVNESEVMCVIVERTFDSCLLGGELRAVARCMLRHAINLSISVEISAG